MLIHQQVLPERDIFLQQEELKLLFAHKCYSGVSITNLQSPDRRLEEAVNDFESPNANRQINFGNFPAADF